MVQPIPPANPPPKALTIQQAVAWVLNVDLTQCTDPQECAAIRSCRQKQVADAYVEAFYAREGVIQSQHYSVNLTKLRDMAVTKKTLKVPVSECDSRLAMWEPEFAEANNLAATTLSVLRCRVCKAEGQLLVDELIPLRLKYTDEEIMALARACCRCEADVGKNLADYHRYAESVSSLSRAAKFADETKVGAFAGYQTEVYSFVQAIRAVLLQEKVESQLIRAKRLRDLAAIALEYSLGASVFTLAK
jgi:hypothetical protein